MNAGRWGVDGKDEGRRKAGEMRDEGGSWKEMEEKEKARMKEEEMREEGRKEERRKIQEG